MLPESVAGNPPRSIVTDHYLLDQLGFVYAI